METLTEMLDQVYLNNSVRHLLFAAVAFFGVFVTMAFLRRVIAAKQERWRDLNNPWVELPAMLLAKTGRYIRIIVGLYLAEKILVLPPKVDRLFDVIIVIGAAVQVAIWLTVALRYYILHRHGLDEWADPAERNPFSVLMFLGQVGIWSIVGLLALGNLGINVTALVAGLGVGGIAIALSVQTILGDLLGSLSIALDKPFVIGDALKIDDIEGTVEKIGIKSTRLRSITGEQIVLANADVLKSRVRNLGRMPERRVSFRLRVAYENDVADIDKVQQIVESAIKAQPDARFVSCLLMDLGVYALEFEAVYFIANVGNLNIPRTMDAVNRAIFEQFASQGILFAYPTQRQLMGTVPAT